MASRYPLVLNGTTIEELQTADDLFANSLPASGVVASTYGGAAVQPVIVVDTYGRITSASNVTSTVANTNITGNIISSQITSVANSQITGNIISSRLEPTGVTASTYGAAAVQSVITIDQQGRITSASNVTSTVANTNITGNIISSQITSVANSQITGNIISSQIQPSGVTAGTYGGATVEGVFTVDQQGRITSASNVTPTVANTNITGNIISSQITSVANSQITGNIISSQIQPTGVTAATYGNATIVPIITIDQQGRITSASNVTVAAGSSGGGGGGAFNTSINRNAGLALTTDAQSIFSAPSTAGQRYIIHSVHVTNISSATPAEVSGTFNGTTYSSNINFSSTVPVPVGTAVELLKQPKVLQPSDIVYISANVASALHAVITYETQTSTTHFGTGVDITTAATNTDLHTANANSMIQSILLTNDDSSTLDVKATVTWTDGSNNIQGYYCFDLIVPNDATVELLEAPKYLPSGHKIRVLANQANRLEALISGRTI